MKLLQLASLLIFGFLTIATSCEEDDICLTPDWAGTYTGTLDCNGDVEDLTLTITASGTNDIVVSYSTPTTTVNFTPVPISNCAFEASFTQDSVTILLFGEQFPDRSISIGQQIENGSTTATCQLNATRN